MGNVEIYRKTLRFSVMRLLVTILGIFIIVALPLATFLVTAGMSEVACAVATFVAFIVGIVVFVLIIRYCGYLFTAAQVAMITEGVSKGTLPDDVYAAGKQAVKRRFVTASASAAVGWSRRSNSHSAFVKPFILISVMRRYIEAGLANPPKVDLYGKLAGMSAGFRKALERDKEEAGAAA